MRTRCTQVRAEVDCKGLLVHFLQADDVGVEAKQLCEDERPPIAGIQKPAARKVSPSGYVPLPVWIVQVTH
jgi:hypothetical protein